MFKTEKMKVRLTFTESILSSSPSNDNLYRDYVGSKAPDAASLKEEIEALGVDGIVEKALTIFPRMADGTPMFWDYQIKGFFKDTCGGLRKIDGTKSKDVKAFKKEIDKLIFVFPRMIPIKFDGEIGICERPLRANTPQGERVALACSEEIPAGAVAEFTIELFNPKQKDLVIEWLNYGVYSGIGQWRNSSKGRFLYELLDDDGNVIGGNLE